jgi:hypothetical protein
MNTTSHLRARIAQAITAGVVLAAGSSAPASIQFVTSLNTPNCDVLANLTIVDELGLMPPFPANEAISAQAQFTNLSACPTSDNPNLPNVQVRIVNLTTLSFTDLHYVADPGLAGTVGTTLSNEDGLVNGGQAFRIDTVGMNQPLMLESINANGIFEPGESWVFIIDDYFNTASIPADAFTSIGVGSASNLGGSSGSIIAGIPEPSLLSLTLAAALPLLRLRRPRDAG